MKTITIYNSEVTDSGGYAVTERGACWSISPNPTITSDRTHDGVGVGQFTSVLTGLTENTIYYVKAYATNYLGAGYGIEKSFTTEGGLTITTTTISGILNTSATGGGNVTSDGGSAVTDRGVCWSISIDPTTGDTRTHNGAGVGSFTSNISGLTQSTQYYVRAYAINALGISYGGQETFTTTSAAVAPTVSTTNITGISINAAVGGGGVSSDGGSAVYERGVCWNTGGSPTIGDERTFDGTGTGGFTSYITGLTQSTTYYVRAYATNSVGTSYGSQQAFQTTSSQTIPQVSFDVPSYNLTSSQLTLNGNCISDGGTPILVYGFCWSGVNYGEIYIPTTADTKSSTAGPYFGSYSYTGYHNEFVVSEGQYVKVRAYATNAIGTAYSALQTIGPVVTSPTVTTTEIVTWLYTTATGGGEVVADGASTVIDRGVCWNTGGSPTILDSRTHDGTGLGVFTSNLSGLSESTTYYYKAYATNAIDTSYGVEHSFTTDSSSGLPTVTSTQIDWLSNTGYSFVANSNVTSDGGAAVTSRGLIWGPSPTPTENTIVSGSGTGAFTSAVSGYSANTQYYYMAYATNVHGTVNSSPVRTFYQDTQAPTVPIDSGSTGTLDTYTLRWSGSTDNIAVVRYYLWQNGEAIGGGGYVPASTHSWAFDGCPIGIPQTFVVTARDAAGNESASLSKTWTPGPILSTNAVTQKSYNSGFTGGNITTAGGYSITARGVCWDTLTSPTISDQHTNDGTGTGSFTSSMTGLTEAGIRYFVRAYATCSAGTAYGNEVSFITSDAPLTPPSVTTNSVTRIGYNSGYTGGNADAGGYSITAMGVCWNTIGSPTISNSHTTDGSGGGLFTSSITGLTESTTYYVKAYVNSTYGIVYGNQVTFSTSSAPAHPDISTTTASIITTTTARSGGVVISYNGYSITTAGSCWNTIGSPTTGDNYTTDAVVADAWTSTLTGLSIYQTYYVRSYVTGTFGITYGNQISFTTQSALPTMTTSSATNITTTGATGGGSALGGGGFSISAAGICWSTSLNPTTGSTHTTDLIYVYPTGSFWTSSMTGLVSSTLYHMRSYATGNYVGTPLTIYGSDVIFTTAAVPTPANNSSYGISKTYHLKWLPITPPAAQYLVYSGLTGGTVYLEATIISGVPVDHSISTILSGNKYNFTVKAQDSFGNLSAGMTQMYDATVKTIGFGLGNVDLATAMAEAPVNNYSDYIGPFSIGTTCWVQGQIDVSLYNSSATKYLRVFYASGGGIGSSDYVKINGATGIVIAYAPYIPA